MAPPESFTPIFTGSSVVFEDVTIEAGGVPIVTSVRATVPPGSFTAIIGANGAGKTTLLLALLGRIAHRGRVRLIPATPGVEPRVGYVPQRLEFDRGMPLTVMEVLLMGRQRRPLWFRPKPQLRAEALELLAQVGAGHLQDRQFGALSAGEQQRVLVALALQRDPDLLILDEPAAGVDILGEQLLCGLLDRLRAERGFTQLMVSHDLAVVTAHADHVICLNHRLIGEGPPREILTPTVLEATFGIHRGLPDLQRLPEQTLTQQPELRCKECG
jgi:zinc transport system ATP-binding protein